MLALLFNEHKIVSTELRAKYVLRSEYDQRMKSIDQKFEDITEIMLREFDKVGDRFEAVDRKFEAVELRFNRIDNNFDILNKNMGTIMSHLGIADKQIII